MPKYEPAASRIMGSPTSAQSARLISLYAVAMLGNKLQTKLSVSQDLHDLEANIRTLREAHQLVRIRTRCLNKPLDIQLPAPQDPYDLEGYLLHNPFLPDINNELPVKNETYRANLVALDRLVLFRFEDDGTVVPRASEWFGFFDGNELVGGPMPLHSNLSHALGRGVHI